MLPAGTGTGTAGHRSVSRSSMKWSRRSRDNIPQRWVPGTKRRQPLSRVASSIAVQAVTRSMGKISRQEAESWCPRLRRAGHRRLHEQLVAVHLDVVGAEQVGHDVDHRRVGGVLPQQLVVHRHVEQLAGGKHAVRHRGGAVAKHRLQLQTGVGNMLRLAGGDQVRVVPQCRRLRRRSARSRPSGTRCAETRPLPPDLSTRSFGCVISGAECSRVRRTPSTRSVCPDARTPVLAPRGGGRVYSQR